MTSWDDSFTHRGSFLYGLTEKDIIAMTPKDPLGSTIDRLLGSDTVNPDKLPLAPARLALVGGTATARQPAAVAVAAVPAATGPSRSLLDLVNAGLPEKPASPTELAEAIFRVNLNPRRAGIDLRAAGEMQPAEKLTLTMLERKVQTPGAMSLTDEALKQLTLWRTVAPQLGN